MINFTTLSLPLKRDHLPGVNRETSASHYSLCALVTSPRQHAAATLNVDLSTQTKLNALWCSVPINSDRMQVSLGWQYSHLQISSGSRVEFGQRDDPSPIDWMHL